MNQKHIIIIVAFIIFVYALATMVFTLDETEIAIVLQVGKPMEVLNDAGLHWKLPDPIQTKILFDKRVLVHDPVAREYLTGDKKNIVVNFFIGWKIIDPLMFLQAVKDRRGAELRLEDVLNSEAGAVFGNYPLNAFVSNHTEEMRLQEIMQTITDNCDERAQKRYGIEVLEVKMKRFNFPDENKPSVFSRMKAERARIAKKYRSEGEETAVKIEAEANKQKEIILSESYKKAEHIKGEGDAKAMNIYASAYNKDPEFYIFLRTLQSYEKFLDEKTTILLDSDMELLKFLENKKSEIIDGKR